MAAVVGVLVISFAIWGIGDIFRGFGRSTLAKVGKTEITIEVFRNLYTERLQRIGREIGRPITLEQARELGLDRQVVRQLFTEFVLDERVRSLGLNVTDAEIARRIMADPSFQGTNGKFDRQRFEALIRQAGFTEQRYVADQRKVLLRRQLGGTVIGAQIVPKAEIEAADRYHNEMRSIEYVLFDRAQAGDIPAPPAEVLAAYFEERKLQFRAPEFRKAILVVLIPGELAQWIEIPEADLRKAYEERRARYLTPEQRHLQQILFRSMDDAKTGAERIAKGESFEAIAKEQGLSDKDIDLGTLTKAAMLDRVVADAAFALKEGEISAPVQGRFGIVLLRAVKIEPESTKSFEEVAPQLKKDLALERAKAEVLKTYDQVEDERSLGKPLHETAEKLKLASRTIEVDRLGRDPAGAPVTNLPIAQRLLTAIFAAEAGLDNDALQVEGGYAWYEVTGITPARDRTLDEVKDEVEARWKQDEMANRLRAKAKEVLDKVQAGTALAEAAGDLKVDTKTGIKRGPPTPPLSAPAVDSVFRTAKDAAAAAAAGQPGEQIVFRVTAIEVPELDIDSEETKRLRQSLNSALSEDLLNEFIAQVESEVGVTINQKALQQVITGQTVPDDN